MNYKQIAAQVTGADVWNTVNGISVSLDGFNNAIGEGETLQEAVVEALVAAGVNIDIAFDASSDITKKISK